MSDQDRSTANASVETQVQLRPKASQTFLVSLAVLAGVCIICGSLLLMAEKDAGWFIAGLSLPLIAAALWGWRAAQSDTDMHGAPPTTISVKDGMTVSTDSRNMRNVVAIQGLREIVEAQNRIKLPQADGIVEDGRPVPGSSSIANERVRDINQNVEAQQHAFTSGINRTQGVEAVIQPPEITLPPDSDEVSLAANFASVQQEAPHLNGS